MQSYLSPDAAAKDHLVRVHGSCNRLLSGDQITDLVLQSLAGALRYCLATVLDRATELRDRLGIEFEDSRSCDIQSYRNAPLKDKQKSDKCSQVFRPVVSSSLFDQPGIDEDMACYEDGCYLAMVLIESGWNNQQVEMAVDKLLKYKVNYYSTALLSTKLT